MIGTQIGGQQNSIRPECPDSGSRGAQNMGVDRVVTVDLHAEQIMGFFSKNWENVPAAVRPPPKPQASISARVFSAGAVC